LKKAVFYKKIFDEIGKKMERTSIICLKKPEHPFLASQLPNLGCYYHWKRNLIKEEKKRRNIKKHPG